MPSCHDEMHTARIDEISFDSSLARAPFETSPWVIECSFIKSAFRFTPNFGRACISFPLFMVSVYKNDGIAHGIQQRCIGITVAHIVRETPFKGIYTIRKATSLIFNNHDKNLNLGVGKW